LVQSRQLKTDGESEHHADPVLEGAEAVGDDFVEHAGRKAWTTGLRAMPVVPFP